MMILPPVAFPAASLSLNTLCTRSTRRHQGTKAVDVRPYPKTVFLLLRLKIRNKIFAILMFKGGNDVDTRTFRKPIRLFSFLS